MGISNENTVVNKATLADDIIGREIFSYKIGEKKNYKGCIKTNAFKPAYSSNRERVDKFPESIEVSKIDESKLSVLNKKRLEYLNKLEKSMDSKSRLMGEYKEELMKHNARMKLAGDMNKLTKAVEDNYHNEHKKVMPFMIFVLPLLMLFKGIATMCHPVFNFFMYGEWMASRDSAEKAGFVDLKKPGRFLVIMLLFAAVFAHVFYGRYGKIWPAMNFTSNFVSEASKNPSNVEEAVWSVVACLIPLVIIGKDILFFATWFIGEKIFEITSDRVVMNYEPVSLSETADVLNDMQIRLNYLEGDLLRRREIIWKLREYINNDAPANDEYDRYMINVRNNYYSVINMKERKEIA